MLGLDVKLTWMATTKLLFNLPSRATTELVVLANPQKSTKANLVGNYSFNTHWSAMANLGYTETDYYYIGVRTNNSQVVCVLCMF